MSLRLLAAKALGAAVRDDIDGYAETMSVILADIHGKAESATRRCHDEIHELIVAAYRAGREDGLRSAGQVTPADIVNWAADEITDQWHDGIDCLDLADHIRAFSDDPERGGWNTFPRPGVRYQPSHSE